MSVKIGTSIKNSDDFARMAAPILDQYRIPLPVGMGQYAAEGREKGIGASRNNRYNIGGFDGKEKNMPSYKTPEEGVHAYAKLLTTDKRYAGALKYRDNPAKMLKAIQDANYAGDPKTYMARAKNKYPSYSAFVMDTPEYKKHAE
jgi:hypothetical protein